MANGQPAIPKLTGKDEIRLQRKTIYTLSCPKCDSAMDVTSVNPNTYIECHHCANITWRPDYSPPWWAKTRNFILSLLGALVLGIVTGVISGLIVENYSESRRNEIHEVKSKEDNEIKKDSL